MRIIEFPKSSPQLRLRRRTLIFLALQFPQTVLTSTNLEKEKAVFIRSIQMVQGSLVCSVTKQQPEGGG